MTIKNGKVLTVVVSKSGNVQKKVPYTTYVLTGKIVKIFLLQRRYWEEKKGGTEGNSANSHNFTLKDLHEAKMLERSLEQLNKFR